MRKNIWDFWAGRYERLWVQKHSLKPTRELLISEISRFAEQKKPVHLLDVGCGTGQLAEAITRQFTPQGVKVTGLDFSPKMVELARGKKLPAVEFVTGDACELPFAKGSFDLVTCSHSFPYYPDKVRALREFLRVLKPGGHVLLIQASENNLYDFLAMRLVKLTTGSAEYPSKAETARLLREAGAELLYQKRLKTQFYMPSIILSVSKNGVAV